MCNKHLAPHSQSGKCVDSTAVAKHAHMPIPTAGFGPSPPDHLVISPERAIEHHGIAPRNRSVNAGSWRRMPHIEQSSGVRQAGPNRVVVRGLRGAFQ